MVTGLRTDAPPIPDGCVLVLGGRSEIGVEVAERLCAGRSVVLAARRSGDLTAQRERLVAAGATDVRPVEFDADDIATHSELISRLADEHGPIGAAIVAFGILGDHDRAVADPMHAAQIAHTDYTAQVSVLTALANVLRMQRRPGRRGVIVAFSSVAGVRVRRGNYIYGSAKAGLDGFVQGFTDALHGSGVHVLLVRPGFVVGRMTADLMARGVKPAPPSSTPGQVADATVAALAKGRHEVWVPPALQALFAIARLVPRAVWRRMPR